MIKLLNSTVFHIVLGCVCVGVAGTWLSKDMDAKPKILVEMEKVEAAKRAAGTWSKSDDALKSAVLEATPEQLAEIDRQTEATRAHLDGLAAELRK